MQHKRTVRDVPTVRPTVASREATIGRGEKAASDGALRARDPLAKAVRVLNWIVGTPATDWGVREIARGLGLPPSTVHRVLSDLEAQGLVRAEAGTGRYLLGLELYRIAWMTVSRFPLREIAMPTLQGLVAACNETAFLGLYEPARTEMIFVATVESSQELRYVVPLNTWGPVYRGSSGLAILAHLPETEQQQVLSRAKIAESRRREPVDTKALRSTLERVRRRGYSRTVGQRTAGAVGISAPVFSDRGVVGSLGLSIPELRFNERDEPRLAKLVIEAAQQITRNLRGVTGQFLALTRATPRA